MTPKTLNRTLAIKERLRQVRRAELVEAEALVNEAQHWVEEETTRHDGSVALITRAGEFSANELALQYEQVEATQRQLKRARTELDTREAEREVRKDVMGEATREVRAIEALRGRLLAEQKREADKNEQRELDEASSRKGRPQ
jgi:flagellar export protein FliJ